MTNRPQKLQGTDGIRGRITTNQSLKNEHPLDIYFKSNLLTPAFFERYAYAFGCLLLQSDLATANNSVIIGWDPRDKEGKFNQAAIVGIRKSGLNAIVVGTLPTPAIPLYMIESEACGCIVLTASHNPSDQNGIKLFCGHTALKFLPPDDIKLTEKIYQQSSISMESLDKRGEIQYREAEAKEYFVRYCLDARNSWIDNDDFRDIVLVLDASNGAVAEVVKEIFSDLPFQEVVFTNMQGNINENSGVADIEGLEAITRESVMNPGGRFSKYQTLVTMFEKATAIKDEESKSSKVVAFVFDGDGDRCFRLDYLPESDSLRVSSGDLLGVHQATYLKKQISLGNSLFINTVESDLNTAIAARNLGFNPILTGVGDKWILSRAVLDLIESRLPQQDRIKKQFIEISERNSGVSALELSRFWKSLNEDNLAANTENSLFQIGIEESGHCITPGYIDKKNQAVTVFSGNGIKTALNSLKALSGIVSDEQWYRTIEEPFESGVGKTFYTYYVNKQRLNPGSEFRNKLQSLIQQSFYDYFSRDYEMEIVEFAEEREMLYCSILENNKQCGAVFTRNSGTEDKSALYLRGEMRLSQSLEELGETLHLYMLNGMKDRTNGFAKFEINTLNALEDGAGLDKVVSDFPDLPHERILKEMELKEGLIESVNGVRVLTEKGKRFLKTCV